MKKLVKVLITLTMTSLMVFGAFSHKLGVARAQTSLLELEREVKWEKLFTKSGITLFSATRADSNLPLLKGAATLPLNLYEIMAVVEDAKRHPEWVYRMSASKIFDRFDPFHLKAYVQFDFPWPASDRDSVLKVEVKRVWTPHHEVWISFERITDSRYPTKSGSVRVAQSRGYTRLRWRSPTRTDVVYVIDSDPGGRLPHWLVRWLSRDLPFKVIIALKKRVFATRGEYDVFLNRWDPRRTRQSDAPTTYSLKGVSPSEVK